MITVEISYRSTKARISKQVAEDFQLKDGDKITHSSRFELILLANINYCSRAVMELIAQERTKRKLDITSDKKLPPL